MSENRAERARQSFELFAAGDLDGWLETIHPDVEWDISAHPLPDWPDRGSGRDALARNLLGYLSGWNDYEAEIGEVVDLGDEILLTMRERARMRGSDVPLDRELHQLWSFDGDLARRLRVFKTRRDAVAAAGR